MFTRNSIILFLILVSFSAFAQDDNIQIIDNKQDSIKNLMQKIITIKNTNEKLKYGDTIANIFKSALEQEGSWDYQFDSLKTSISILKSDDNKVKIYTWSIFFDDRTFKYYGFVQTKNSEISVFFLDDKSDEIKNVENKNLDHNEWFGAIYYKILKVKNGKNTSYTLLGWDGNNNLSQKKIIEGLSFSKKGEPQFGSSFEIDKKRTNRVIFEYNKQANMILRYDDKYKMIIFDHLSPAEYKYTGLPQYYGPDFSYDALFYEKGKWNYLSDVDVRNPEKKKKAEKKKLRYGF